MHAIRDETRQRISARTKMYVCTTLTGTTLCTSVHIAVAASVSSHAAGHMVGGAVRALILGPPGIAIGACLGLLISVCGVAKVLSSIDNIIQEDYRRIQEYNALQETVNDETQEELKKHSSDSREQKVLIGKQEKEISSKGKQVVALRALIKLADTELTVMKEKSSYLEKMCVEMQKRNEQVDIRFDAIERYLQKSDENFKIEKKEDSGFDFSKLSGDKRILDESIEKAKRFLNRFEQLEATNEPVYGEDGQVYDLDVLRSIHIKCTANGTHPKYPNSDMKMSDPAHHDFERADLHRDIIARIRQVRKSLVAPGPGSSPSKDGIFALAKPSKNDNNLPLPARDSTLPRLEKA